MLVTFALDEEAIAIGEGNIANLEAAHDRLLSLWRRLGVLMIDQNLLRVIRELPQALRKDWKASLVSNRTTRIPDNWKGFGSVSSSIDLLILKERIDLACLKDARAECVGLSKGSTSCMLNDTEFEICRFADADQSRAFKGAVFLAEEGILTGIPINKLWKDRFSKLSQFAKHVAVVDRYAVKELCRDNRKNKSGLWNLVNFLNSDSQDSSVTIFSTISDDLTRAEVQESLNELFQGTKLVGIRELTIRLGKEHIFKKEVHDRWIRFDNTVCEIGIGLSVFRGHETMKASTFTAKSRTRFTRYVENYLSENCSDIVKQERMWNRGRP